MTFTMSRPASASRLPLWVVSSILAAQVFATDVPLTILHDSSDKGAVCLDGSPPGYYWKHGLGDGENKWIVHQQGGGWCFDEDECLLRSKTSLGSSTLFQKTKSLLHAGFSADDCVGNPVFCNYNLLYMPYCDGGSFSGNREDAIVVNGTAIYMRGKRILDAIFDKFTEQFNEAEEMILTGCSAGGLATYLHADYPVTRIPSSAKYAVLADAGYFTDALDQNGQQWIRPRMQYVYRMQNASGGVNQRCIAATPPAEQWKCFFAQYTVPHVRSPIFALQSQYDYWQLRGVLRLACVPPNCSQAEYQVFLNWRATFLKAFAPILNGSTTAGIYSDACIAHCQTVAAAFWDNYEVGGQRIRETFAAWYFNLPDKSHREVDCAYPCNHHCSVPPPCYEDEDDVVIL